MFRKLLVGVGIVVMAGLSGCIDNCTVVTVGKNGAGTIVETTYMSKAMIDMMTQMMGGMGGEGATVQKNPMLQDEAKYRTKAAAMGQGVTFVSVREAKKADGSMGAQVTYAFQDINKVRLDSEPDTPAAGGGPGEAPATAKPKSPITFSFVKGGTSKLTINNTRKDTPAAGAADEPAATPPAGDGPTPEQMAQMKQMFDGFRVRVIVKVDGEITKSNASFAEKNPATGKKQLVTLLDMDIGSLMKDEATFKKMAAMGKIKDVATAKERMKDFPGLKIETEDKVDIEFK